MKQVRPLSIIAILFTAAAVGFLVRSCVNTRTGIPEIELPTLVDEHGSQRLETAEQFLTPISDEQRALIPGKLAQAVKSVQQLDHQDSLLLLFEERIRMLLDPDLDDYIKHVADMTGNSPSQIRGKLGERFLTRWDIDTKLFRDASFATDQCTLSLGDSANVQAGGILIAKRDPGFYETANLLSRQDAQLAEFRIPVILAVSMNGRGQTLVLDLVMGFVWNPSRSVWVPHVVALHDPSAVETRLPAPWI